MPSGGHVPHLAAGRQPGSCGQGDPGRQEQQQPCRFCSFCSFVLLINIFLWDNFRFIFKRCHVSTGSCCIPFPQLPPAVTPYVTTEQPSNEGSSAGPAPCTAPDPIRIHLFLHGCSRPGPRSHRGHRPALSHRASSVSSGPERLLLLPLLFTA